MKSLTSSRTLTSISASGRYEITDVIEWIKAMMIIIDKVLQLRVLLLAIIYYCIKNACVGLTICDRE
jgi:hypothetical protein